jgi:hypothetical protein
MAEPAAGFRDFFAPLRLYRYNAARFRRVNPASQERTVDMTSTLRLIAMALTLTILPLLVAGCSGKHKLVAEGPSWVNRGSGAFKDQGSRIFYGVGAVTGISSQSLAVQTADQRARADIARQLDTFVTGLFRDYQTSTVAVSGKSPVEEQHVDNTLKNLTRISVHGAKVIDHWRDPKTDTIYSLVRLDLEGIKETVGEMREMDQSLRGYVRSHAESAFDEMRRDEQRR